MHPDWYVLLLRQIEEYRPYRIPRHDLFGPTMDKYLRPKKKGIRTIILFMHYKKFEERWGMEKALQSTV